MGASAAIAIGSAIFGPMISQAVGLTKKPQTPNLVVEQPPQPAGAVSPEGAGAQQQKKAAGAMGRSDTIETGPQGLGTISPDNQAPKSLLGY